MWEVTQGGPGVRRSGDEEEREGKRSKRIEYCLSMMRVTSSACDLPVTSTSFTSPFHLAFQLTLPSHFFASRNHSYSSRRDSNHSLNQGD